MNPGRSDPGFWCRHWLRGTDSNRRPSGYEPDELPLLHPATAHGSDRSKPGQTESTTLEPVRRSHRRLVQPTGLPTRTGRRSLADMFRHHRTHPHRETAAIVSAFHERLAGSPVTDRTDPPRIDPRDLRVRLGRPTSGLRDRIGSRLETA